MTSAERLLLTLLAVFGAAMAAGTQQAETFEAGNLRDACQNLVLALRGVQETSPEDPGAMLCFGYLAGWSQAMESGLVRGDERGTAIPYCRPEERAIVPGELAELLLDYVDSDAGRRSLSAHDVLVQALAEAFPCPEDASDNG